MCFDTAEVDLWDDYGFPWSDEDEYWDELPYSIDNLRVRFAGALVLSCGGHPVLNAYLNCTPEQMFGSWIAGPIPPWAWPERLRYTVDLTLVDGGDWGVWSGVF